MERPGFKFGKAGRSDLPPKERLDGEMLPQEVDLKYNEDQLKIAKHFRALSLAQRSKRQVGKPSTDQELDAIIKDTTSRITLIKEADGVMKPGGVVMLLNCSAAATPEGKKMVNDIGQITLGKYGGTIIASTVDIRLKEVEDIADRITVMVKEWENVDWGSPRIYGEWVHFPIPGREKAPPPAVKPSVVTSRPPSMPKAGVFTRTKKSFGHFPKNYEGPEHRIVGDMTPVSFSLTVERKPASEGAVTITHVYHGGPIGETLNPSDVVELTCVSEGKTSGRYPPNIGGSCHWYVEGGAGSLTFTKDKDGKDQSTPHTFVGVASDGKIYPSGTSKTKFTVGSGGSITIRAAQGGYAWGEGTDNWNPAEYVYTFTSAH